MKENTRLFDALLNGSIILRFILNKYVVVIELPSSERVVVDSVIKLRFHGCGNSINHWNDLSSKEWHLPLGVWYVGVYM